MAVDTWYDPAQHQRARAPPSQADILDSSSLYDQCQYKHREMAVKEAHMKYIEEKLRRCVLYHGVHNYKVHCRFLMEEFKQVKDEMFGWSEHKRVLSIYGMVSNVCNV